jgi:hypothetical protein
MANSFTAVKKVILGPHHLCPGRTRHSIADAKGQRDFPPFVRLEIAQYQGDQGFYLLHISEDGSIADTHHETLAEAFHQAEWEFEVKADEWE